MADRDPGARARWLASPEGRTAIDAALAALTESGGDPLRAGDSLRRTTGLASDLAAAALDQAALAELARQRIGIDRSDLLLTRDGLEAATRPEVARHRAELLRAAGVQRVVDLTGGLGFDTAAFLEAGLEVTTLERDPVIATYLRHNCPRADVVCADATSPGVLAGLLDQLGPDDAVFIDPARRDTAAARDAVTARARPERDPERWSPPWSWVASIDHPRIAAKVAPSFEPPVGWCAQWLSIDRTVVECAVYSWSVQPRARRAVVVADNVTVTDTDAEAEDPAWAAELGPWLHEIDPAVIRAGAVSTLAREQDLTPLGPGLTWLTGDRPSAHPALRSHRIVAVLDHGDRAARRQLADLGVTRAVVKTRDSTTSPAQVLRSLGLREGRGLVVVLTNVAGSARRVLVEPHQPLR